MIFRQEFFLFYRKRPSDKSMGDMKKNKERERSKMRQNSNRKKSELPTDGKRKRAAVLFGGCSPEYGVSLQSAAAVLAYMDKTKYEPVPVGITHTGDWFYYTGEIGRIADDSWCGSGDCVPVTVSLNRNEQCLLLMRGDHAERLKIDVALPVLHGKNGEDGTVQGLFELAGIPVAGCGILSSALCMDKDRAHRLAKEAGIRVPVSFVSRRNADREAAAGRAGQIGYPLFVKPVKAGSSYGITKVSDESELQGAMELALAYDDEIMIEECISGFEVGCAVMGTGDMVLGEVDEIELAEGFFDFTEKYTLKTSAIHVPARISPDLARRVKESAKRIYRALDCRGFARVDMFLTKEEEIVFNEVNTIPGFTTHSRFPNMMKAAGISFEEVVSEILEEALSRA
jgi:D-alanine---D-serine ligase